MTEPRTEAAIREELVRLYTTVAYNQSAEADKTRRAILLAEELASVLPSESRTASVSAFRSDFDDLVEKAKDQRYSDEWVGIAFRARLDDHEPGSASVSEGLTVWIAANGEPPLPFSVSEGDLLDIQGNRIRWIGRATVTGDTKRDLGFYEDGQRIMPDDRIGLSRAALSPQSQPETEP